MNCEICDKKDMDTTVILPPGRIVKPGEPLNVMACLECAKGSALYCHKHEKPHLGFEDGSTACIGCIEEKVFSAKWQAILYSNQIKESLSEDGYREIYREALKASRVVGSTPEMAILRFIITKAMRKHQTEVEVLKEVALTKKAEVLLT